LVLPAGQYYRLSAGGYRRRTPRVDRYGCARRQSRNRVREPDDSLAVSPVLAVCFLVVGEQLDGLCISIVLIDIESAKRAGSGTAS